MFQWKTKEGKQYVIFLLVLAIVTVMAFVLVFFDISLPGRRNQPTEQPADTSAVRDPEIAAQIASHRALMNEYQTQLASTYLLLVDEQHPLPEDYAVEPIDVSRAQGVKLEPAAAAALDQFLAAAESAGFAPKIKAGYRTAKEQDAAYSAAVESYMQAGYTAEQARGLAAQSVGAAGTSEHETGLAFDLSAESLAAENDEKIPFSNYVVNALPEYGFALSYPTGSESVTGRSASAVHYRYVGVSAAKVMTARGLTLGQYRDYLQTQIDYQQQQIDSLEKK